MARLLFEIWEDPDNHSFEMSAVTERGDALRQALAPRSVLRHSFRAGSDFEAFQMNHDWHGWRRWKPEADSSERCFTDDEAAAQEEYLTIRRFR